MPPWPVAVAFRGRGGRVPWLVVAEVVLAAVAILLVVLIWRGVIPLP